MEDLLGDGSQNRNLIVLDVNSARLRHPSYVDFAFVPEKGDIGNWREDDWGIQLKVCRLFISRL
jgi:hypothetical protein